jgi:hypothetical protein
MKKSNIRLPKDHGISMDDFINEIYFAGIKEGIRLCKGALDGSPCDNSDPEDMCEDCDCWKAFRKSCS